MKTSYDNRTLGPDNEDPPRRYREGEEADDFAERAKEFCRTLNPEDVFPIWELEYWARMNDFVKQSKP